MANVWHFQLKFQIGLFFYSVVLQHYLLTSTETFLLKAQLIASTVRALSRLPALCSPKGALTILPSVMWLVTGVLKESTGRGSPSAGVLFEGSDSSPQVAAALQSIKALVRFFLHNLPKFTWVEKTFGESWTRSYREFSAWISSIRPIKLALKVTWLF